METLVIGDKTLETSLKAQQDPVWLIGRSDGIRYLLSSIAKWSEDDVSSNYGTSYVDLWLNQCIMQAGSHNTFVSSFVWKSMILRADTSLVFSRSPQSQNS